MEDVSRTADGTGMGGARYVVKGQDQVEGAFTEPHHHFEFVTWLRLRLRLRCQWVGSTSDGK